MADKQKIIMAMSGGVDSSAAAAMLKNIGFDIIGVTLMLKGETDEISRLAIADTVEKLGIEHHYIDCRKEFFERVIHPSALEYSCGRTPNPCCLCNRVMKFAALFDFADRLGVERVATGHYAKLIKQNNRIFLARGTDAAKDQSYFLYRLPDFMLQRVMFPLAELTKSDIRAAAKEAQLKVFDRPDSQDVCFAVENECCGETLRRLADIEIKTGNFLWQNKKVGEHKGIHLYTVGQRKGLGVALGTPAYISSIAPYSADIILTTNESELITNSFAVKDHVWNCERSPEDIENLTVKIRYRTRDAACRVEKNGDRWLVSAKEGTVFRAVTPGQSAVFYSGELLLGGGIIC